MLENIASNTGDHTKEIRLSQGCGSMCREGRKKGKKDISEVNIRTETEREQQT